MRNKFLLFFILLSFNLIGQGIVTTTSWVAAYAEAAGAENVYYFAPVEMVHPPEYELKPTDVLKLKTADFIIFAGYEAMVEQLKGPLELKEENLLQIETGFGYKVLSESILKVANKLGTVDYATKSLAEIFKLYETKREQLKADGFLDKKILVHFHQQQIARELGLNIVGIFGPGPIKPSELAKFKKNGADFIIDNIHSPKGKSLMEVLPDAKYLTFVNFPGTNGTESLTDVILYNMDQLNKK